MNPSLPKPTYSNAESTILENPAQIGAAALVPPICSHPPFAEENTETPVSALPSAATSGTLRIVAEPPLAVATEVPGLRAGFN